MTQYVKTSFQLKDQNGQALSGTGGQVYVAAAGDAAKVAIYDKDGVALTNARALTAGGVQFHTVSTVTSVDLYIQAPGGQFLTKLAVPTGAYYDLVVDTSNKKQVFVIPFAAADLTAATEKNTGFVLPAHSQVLGKYNGLSVRVSTADATETLDVGTLESGGAGGGDANGFIAANALTTATQVIGTEGALFTTSLPYLADSATEKSISVTTTAGTDTAEGFVVLPVVLE